MERLTKRNGLCVKAVNKGDFGTQNILHRLAEYEDLGFTPEDIACMAKFYKERTSAEYIANEMHIVAKLLEAERKEAHWIEHKYAEEDNGLLISNYECSNCHEWKRENSEYCPVCGCKIMEVT